jgi:hypothetical protein
MAISRGVVLFGFGTLLVCLFLIKVSEANDSEYPPIHAVRHDDSKCEGQVSTPIRATSAGKKRRRRWMMMLMILTRL